MACIYKHGWYGHLKSEAAAWLVQDEKSERCKFWPSTNEYMQTTWKGRVPENVTGILHTHPSTADYRPSKGDEEVAYKLRVPNYVVSSQGVWAAIPTQERKVVIHKIMDFKEIQKSLDFLNEVNCPDKIPKYKELLIDALD